MGPAGAPFDGAHFVRDDTIYARLSADRQRVLFIASGDHGENPDHNCEFFSIDRTGANLRQLTHIGQGTIKQE